MVTLNIQVSSQAEADRILAAVFGTAAKATSDYSGESGQITQEKIKTKVAKADPIKTTNGASTAPIERVTLEALRHLVQTLAASGKKDAVVAEFAEFGAKKLAEISADNYEALHEKLSAL